MRRLHVPTNGPPDTPGEILVDQYLKPLGITALRFSKALGTTPDLWLNMQRVVDLYAVIHSPVAGEIEKIKPINYAEVA